MPLFLPERFFCRTTRKLGSAGKSGCGLLKRATIAGHAELDADTDTMVFIETYTFDDGHSDTLHWSVRKGDGGKYTGLER